jgi:hypothetical protein
MGFLGGLLSLTNIHVIPDGGTINGKHVNYIQNARGGTNLPTGWSLVGEEGPEFIHLKGGETILPHGTSPSSSGGSERIAPSAGGSISGGGQSGPVTIAVYLDSQMIGHATAPHIVQEMRVRTGMRN